MSTKHQEAGELRNTESFENVQRNDYYLVLPFAALGQSPKLIGRLSRLLV